MVTASTPVGFKSRLLQIKIVYLTPMLILATYLIGAYSFYNNPYKGLHIEGNTLLSLKAVFV